VSVDRFDGWSRMAQHYADEWTSRAFVQRIDNPRFRGLLEAALRAAGDAALEAHGASKWWYLVLPEKRGGRDMFRIATVHRSWEVAERTWRANGDDFYQRHRLRWSFEKLRVHDLVTPEQLRTT
jgi:hypothetical protein